MSDDFGSFEGDVVTKWLKDKDQPDRMMKLDANFAYVDPSGKRWEAAKGREVNGASIPPFLWNIVGPPYVGDYRRATVLHDVACDDQGEPHAQVHRMFYNAMRCDGVERFKAALMYLAVARFGPTWETGKTETFSPARDMTSIDLYALEFAIGLAISILPEDAGLDELDKRITEILQLE